MQKHSLLLCSCCNSLHSVGYRLDELEQYFSRESAAVMGIDRFMILLLVLLGTKYESKEKASERARFFLLLTRQKHFKNLN